MAPYANLPLRKLVQGASSKALESLCKAAESALQAHSGSQADRELLGRALGACQMIRDRRSVAVAEALPDHARQRIATCLCRIMAAEDLEVRHG
jgi:hypothetical protein